ncbi:hypothetical protein LJR034_002432 [Caballeronia sp. LjRoot34]|uniref:hypothetical protein n=1 Tax=Caballeronia sp. LjRoot34 TaxID=3342325 RepID=UPI003ECE784A
MHLLINCGRALHIETEVFLSSLFLRVGSFEMFIEARPLLKPRLSFEKSSTGSVMNAGWLEVTYGH